MSFEACLHIGQIGSRLIGRRIGGTKSRKFAGIDNLKTSDLNRTLAFSTSFSSPTASQDRGDRMADVTASRSEWGRYTASYEFTAETVGKGEPVSLEDSSLTEGPGDRGRFDYVLRSQLSFKSQYLFAPSVQHQCEHKLRVETTRPSVHLPPPYPPPSQ